MLQKLVEKIIRENAFEQKKEFRINRPSKKWTQIIFSYFICQTNIVQTSKKLQLLLSHNFFQFLLLEKFTICHFSLFLYMVSSSFPSI